MAGTVRIYRPEGSPYAFVDEEKLMGEMEVRGQFKQIREVLAKHVKDEVDRLTPKHRLREGNRINQITWTIAK